MEPPMMGKGGLLGFDNGAVCTCGRGRALGEGEGVREGEGGGGGGRGGQVKGGVQEPFHGRNPSFQRHDGELGE